VKIRQLINILFCGYRRLEIADPRTEPKPILARGTGAPASNKRKLQKLVFISLKMVEMNTTAHAKL
jgi:hypothetical protein